MSAEGFDHMDITEEPREPPTVEPPATTGGPTT